MHAGWQSGATHDPLLHSCDVVHVVPQPPQLCGSLSLLMHAPLQHVRPPAHVHVLPVSGAPPPSLPLASLFVASEPPESVPPPSTLLIVPPHAARKTHKPSEISFIYTA
jgi:hypothetical protein